MAPNDQDDGGDPRGPQYKTAEQLHAMTYRELADYLEGCDYEYDGLGRAARAAIVRLLRKK
jgi:hypothetical protein